MSSVVIIPFNFQPASAPARKTGAYTIPAGKYGLITNASLDTTIEGEYSFATQVSTGSNAGTVTTNHTFFPGGPLMAMLFDKTGGSDTANLSFVGRPVGTGTAGTSYQYASVTGTNNFNIFLVNDGIGEIVFTFTRVGAGSGIANSYTFLCGDTPQPTWVPSGTDLDGSGYTVTLYNELT